ncbi:MAG TPA: helix-turn-helix transcriptional regulator [Candidatus Elarobacter sp.]|jgi:transcriptional regulator with XRE-family HTH domain
MDEIETLAKRLRRLREEQGVSIAQLADACGTSEGAIRQIEHGRVRSPALHLGLRIARHLGVDPYYLAYGEAGSYATRLEDLANAVLVVQRRLDGLTAQLANIERKRR